MTSQVAKITYNIAALMEQTRLVAADYRNTTGQALPVTAELARFDAIDRLNLQKLDGEQGVDAVDANKTQEKYLIKGRVIFKGGKARQKLGQLSLESGWEYLLMVIYDATYQPTQIYKVDRTIIEKELVNSPKDKRGSMTVAKYKAIGELVWSLESE
ncbi:hypothetical protein [Aliikangiella coralliicola]|uniref:Uncharacterized protein n=1 Tax=Aliikangiella coralliicola TaxID=2592383 RepID=A0A545U8J0_9GAMM|nr:hypothetical protein [Aliikangiella coralliicola]TQV85784.1 hypothetical protein FLL46_17825 [Aliikangiella coralliicola]